MPATPRTAFRLPAELLELIDARARETGTTRTAFVIAACETVLDATPQPDQAVPEHEIILSTLSASARELFCRHPVNRRLGNGLCGACGKEA